MAAPKKADGDFVLPDWWFTEEELLASLNVPPTPSDRSEVTLIVPSPRPRRSTPEETSAQRQGFLCNLLPAFTERSFQ
jgi:hypothetical protein